MTELNTPTQALLVAFSKASEEERRPAGHNEGLRISRAVSAVAFWYEKLRTAMEYREDHLLRRSAIQRILTRRLLQTSDSQEITESLLKELVWARYLPGNYIQEESVKKVSSLVGIYLPIIGGASNPVLRNWLTAVAASDIEKLVANSFWVRQEALANFAYYFLSRQIEIVGEADKAEAPIQLYIAVWRAYVHADNELLTFQLLKQRFPDWDTKVQSLGDKFGQLKAEIDGELQDTLSEKLQHFVERNLPPFLVLRDILEEQPGQEAAILADSQKLEETVNQVCQRRYLTIHDRVHRAIVRSIIYIFLTKMVLAFLVEIPIDRFLYGGVSYIALGINSVLPPALMFLFSLSIQVPDQSNTNRILGLLKKLLYEDPKTYPKAIIRLGGRVGRPVLTSVFGILYLMAFLVSFGLIYWLLDILHFSPISKAVFVFFATVVSFFSYRIRRTAHQYLFEEKEGFFSPITNFFMVPILRVGRTLSSGLAQLNLLLFFFDLAIEMPFKVFFDLAEEWSTFIRSKREEIV